ncbi:hypothetical protein ONE63_007708 [Megalurothrips usitatus]|uniref:Trimethyllysine dioxygenase, mitochondrial n=1 Tax=Megalurothrips usitatus TaxID=439358 RepID=A0AAV7XV15_9NEOP|nr:hypothetical protein ONE63_007708 [Megalurothrips usitatus]
MFLNAFLYLDLKVSDDHLVITSQDSTAIKFHYFWLRDHCRCPACYNHSTHQRNLDTFSVPYSIQPKECSIVGNDVQVVWPDGHLSKYSIPWLSTQSFDSYSNRVSAPTRILWKGKPESVAHVPVKSFLETEEGLTQLLKSLTSLGVGIVEGVEPTVDFTAKVIARVASPQRTLFGDVWEMKPSEYHEDTAYSNQALKAHTDNTYFTEAAGLQVFHVLEHKGKGGKTLLVDGFRAAQDVKDEDINSFQVLTETSIQAEYLENGQHHALTSPVLHLHPITGKFRQIRYNLYDRSSMNTVPFSKVMEWYQAMGLLTKAVSDRSGEWWLQLRPDQILFVDNWRVLHGRSAFSGTRWVAGGYIARTDFLSRARMAGALPLDD